MSDSNRTYRIRTEVGATSDLVLNFNLDNDIDMFEVLSLKISRDSIYKLHTSNYGCIAGRVLANGNFGIPNAKISVFVEAESDTLNDSVLSALYPYTSVNTKDNDGVRYNLLPSEAVSDCHRPVGTFPSKRMILDDDNVLEIFDKYYRYTTRTNNAGDYMIFGVPKGTHTVHVDIDLSDIGILSQKPRDMIYKGYNINQFENSSMFKTNKNLDNLTQIISQNSSVQVHSFWGDESEDIISLTRHDIEIQYEFTPTCIFIGSIFSDEKSNGMTENCLATDRMGKMDKLTTGNGTIEMIRKRPDGSVESFVVEGNELIDGNGTWCYQIPMNLDYISTDEYGNIVPTDDPKKGIPTRTRVRFRISLTDFNSEYMNIHLAKVLVPNNPKNYSDLDYAFGSYSLDDEEGTKSFRDLMWNNVYTVKSYIPRIGHSKLMKDKRFTGIKTVNVNGGNNPMPYNNMRIYLTFMFTLQCGILKFAIMLAGIFNAVLATIPNRILGIKLWTRKCISFGGGVCPDLEGWYFAPRCTKGMGDTLSDLKNREKDNVDTKSIGYNNKNDVEDKVCLTRNLDYFMQCIEINLAQEYEVINFDFYNDWLNGTLYVPRWFAHIKKKRSYLFGLIRHRARFKSCMDDNFTNGRKLIQQCALEYGLDRDTNTFTEITTPIGCKKGSKRLRCHRGHGQKFIEVLNTKNKNGGGIVHREQTLQDQYVYYFKPCEWIKKGREDTRIPLFATDIVLLGSIAENDRYGVPHAFEELSSSSYKMPTNLALTNLAQPGFMYGYSGGGTVCSGKNLGDEGVNKKGNNFEEFYDWSKNQEIREVPDPNDVEYAITESSGIDWGYDGPNQGESYTDYAYHPGGHFLGISCTASEASIKSCVNLSRICEIGAGMSQRKSIPYVDKISGEQEGKIKFVHMVPTGLISKEDLSDSEFRSMFATMNMNGLRTEVDLSTGYRKYRFIPMHPVSFGGELKEKVMDADSPYNVHKGFSDNELISMSSDNTASFNGDDNAMALRVTTENTSVDYYKFRLGETDPNEYAKHYLIRSSNRVYMPAYENSYYFYFGLKDGNTAFDRFIKDFYAECPKRSNINPTLIVSTSDPTMDCLNNGRIDVQIENLDPTYCIYLYKNGDITTLNLDYAEDGTANVSIDSSAIRTDKCFVEMKSGKQFSIIDLTEGEYVVNVEGSDGQQVYQKVSLTNTLPESLGQFKVEGTDFESEIYFAYNDAGKKWIPEPSSSNKYGKISVKDIGGKDKIVAVIYKNDDYYAVAPNGSFVYKNFNFANFHAEVKRNNSVAELRNFISVAKSVLGINIKYSNDDRDSVKQISRGGSTYTFEQYAWNGNDDYAVYVVYDNNDEECTGLSMFMIGSVHISMKTPFDLYLNDTDITARKLSSRGYNVAQQGWYVPNSTTNLFTTANTLTEKERWSLKRALFVQDSISSLQPHGMEYGYINEKGKVVETLYGCGELFDEDDGATRLMVTGPNNATNAEDVGFSCSLNSFVWPTVGASPNSVAGGKRGNLDLLDGNIAYVDTSDGDALNQYSDKNFENTKKNDIKYDYKLTAKDASNSSITAFIPQIYRPFYFNALAIISGDIKKPDVRLSYSIVNGVTRKYGEKYALGSININNFVVTYDNDVDDWLSRSNDDFYDYRDYFNDNGGKRDGEDILRYYGSNGKYNDIIQPELDYVDRTKNLPVQTIYHYPTVNKTVNLLEHGQPSESIKRELYTYTDTDSNRKYTVDRKEDIPDGLEYTTTVTTPTNIFVNNMLNLKLTVSDASFGEFSENKSISETLRVMFLSGAGNMSTSGVRYILYKNDKYGRGVFESLKAYMSMDPKKPTTSVEKRIFNNEWNIVSGNYMYGALRKSSIGTSDNNNDIGPFYWQSLNYGANWNGCGGFGFVIYARDHDSTKMFRNYSDINETEISNSAGIIGVYDPYSRLSNSIFEDGDYYDKGWEGDLRPSRRFWYVPKWENYFGALRIYTTEEFRNLKRESEITSNNFRFVLDWSTERFNGGIGEQKVRLYVMLKANTREDYEDLTPYEDVLKSAIFRVYASTFKMYQYYQTMNEGDSSIDVGDEALLWNNDVVHDMFITSDNDEIGNAMLGERYTIEYLELTGCTIDGTDNTRAYVDITVGDFAEVFRQYNFVNGVNRDNHYKNYKIEYNSSDHPLSYDFSNVRPMMAEVIAENVNIVRGADNDESLGTANLTASTSYECLQQRLKPARIEIYPISENGDTLSALNLTYVKGSGVNVTAYFGIRVYGDNGELLVSYQDVKKPLIEYDNKREINLINIDAKADSGCEWLRNDYVTCDEDMPKVSVVVPDGLILSSSTVNGSVTVTLDIYGLSTSYKLNISASKLIDTLIAQKAEDEANRAEYEAERAESAATDASNSADDAATSAGNASDYADDAWWYKYQAEKAQEAAEQAKNDAQDILNSMPSGDSSDKDSPNP